MELNVLAGKSFAPQATTGKQNILFSSLTPDKANNSGLTLRRKEKEITLNYGNELLISLFVFRSKPKGKISGNFKCPKSCLGITENIKIKAACARRIIQVAFIIFMSNSS